MENPASLKFESQYGKVRAETGFDNVCRKAIHRFLDGLTEGVIEIVEGGGKFRFGSDSGFDHLRATVHVRHPKFYRRLLLGGSVGAGESYMEGLWSTPDLVALIQILVRNQATLKSLDSGWSRFGALLNRVFGWLHENTRTGSRKNIAAHYDLGNEFFSLFLDQTMMYSSGIFESESATLQEASIAKLDRICQKLDLHPSDHLLEIGTGWGGFAIHAARDYGCRVTTTTISKEQYSLAVQRAAEAGLSDRITVLLQDYRDLKGTFDKLVSIEMIEAVGARYLDTYFRQCSNLLQPNGLMVLQSITIQDQRYESASREVDFIKRHIFPGGFLPSVTAICSSLTRSTDMRLFQQEDFGPHYAKTLNLWRKAFLSKRQVVKELGYPDTFIRMWEFYLAYCEGAFLERAIGVSQFLLTKPQCRRTPFLAMAPKILGTV